jgi:hypothetical protein
MQFSGKVWAHAAVAAPGCRYNLLIADALRRISACIPCAVKIRLVLNLKFEIKARVKD